MRDRVPARHDFGYPAIYIEVAAAGRINGVSRSSSLSADKIAMNKNIFSQAVIVSMLTIAFGVVATAARADSTDFKIPGKYQPAPRTVWIDGRGSMGTAPSTLAATAKVPALLPVELPPYWGESLLDGYQRALQENKPVVVLYASSGCTWCNKLERDLVASREMEKYLPCAIFVKADVDKDIAAKTLLNGLEIKNYPTLSILMPNPEVVEESGRIVGYMDQETFNPKFQEMIDRTRKAQGDGAPECSVVANAK